MGRAPCCEKGKVKKGPWSPEEDAKLKSFIEHHGTGGNWIALPHKIGLKRCGKSCRLRWLNYLRPNIKHGGFSEEEDNIICSLYVSIGSRWSIIAAQLPGRTDNDIKNYWNTRLKKKLAGGQGKQDMTMKTQSSLHTYPPNIITNPSTPSIQHYYSHLNLTNNHHHHDDMISFQLQHIPTSIINHPSPPLVSSSSAITDNNTNITNTSTTNCHDEYSPNIFEGDDDLSEFVDVNTEQQVLEDAILDLERIMAMSSTQSPITWGWGSHFTSPHSFFSQTQPIIPQFDSTYFAMQ